MIRTALFLIVEGKVAMFCFAWYFSLPPRVAGETEIELQCQTMNDKCAVECVGVDQKALNGCIFLLCIRIIVQREISPKNIPKKNPGNHPGASNQTPQPTHPHPDRGREGNHQSLNQLLNNFSGLKVLKNEICFV